MHHERIGFLGAGQMAEAILRGLLDARLFHAESILASDPLETRRAIFASLGVKAVRDNILVVRNSNVLLVAVKPQNLEELLSQIGPALTRQHLLISICAGCPTVVFEAASGEPLRVVRAMPNLPIRVRMGVTALCPGKHATESDLKLASEIFNAAGRTVRIDEPLMDAVTAMSGSGPAYLCLLVEIMIEAGRREGLGEDVCRELAIQTARGAAEMMAVEGVPPEELRRRVTSKGGTTEAAFRVIESRKVREALLEAIAAAAARARELGGQHKHTVGGTTPRNK